MKQPIKMTPGDELHLTALMAPFSLNLVTGQDRQHLLGYGRAAFVAGHAQLHASTPEAAEDLIEEIIERISDHAVKAMAHQEARKQGNLEQIESARQAIFQAEDCIKRDLRTLASWTDTASAEAEQAAWHAGLDEGRAQAAPAAVAVPDERAAFEAWAKSEDMSIGSDCDGYIHSNTAAASLAWQARAALAATLAAAAPDMVSVKKVDANNYCQILAALGMEEEGDPVAEVQNLLAAAAAPVVLPEPASLIAEKLLALARIVNTAVEDWGESSEDNSMDVKFHSDVVTEMDAILDYFDSLPDGPDENVIESGPAKAARILRALLAGVSAPAAQAGFVPAAAYDRLQALCDSQAARILAVEDANPVHWLAVLDPEQVPHQLKTSMHAVGFRNPRSAESWIAERLDFDGWRYTLEPLYSAPQAQADARDAVERGEVLVTVSGFTGCGKSAVAGEIEIMCRALGLQVEWPDGAPEKNLTHADWTEALELYKPRVRIVECNVPHPFVKGQDK